MGFPLTVTSSAPSGNESTVTVTFGLVLVVDIVVEVTDVALALVVLAVEMAVSRKSSISAVLSFEAVNIFDLPSRLTMRQSVHNFILH
jgi:hypothetical protein